MCTQRTVAEDREDETRGMFWDLFAFIQGDNDRGVKMDMTTPVTTLVVPNEEVPHT